MDFMGRDKNFQNIMRSLVFAPDFWESRLRLAGGMAKSLNPLSADPLRNVYRKSVITLVGSYIAMNLVNKASTGRYMYQNPAGHQMDIQIGHDSKGKVIWIRPFGTSVDFVRLPLDIAKSVLDGDLSPLSSLLGNRVSTLLQPAVRFMSNTDAFGNPIFGRTKYGKKMTIGEQSMGFLKTLPIVPQVVSGLAGLFKGDTQSTAQSLSQALSLPVRFNQPATANVIADLKQQARDDIKNGDYKLLDNLVRKGIISKKGRARFIKDALMSDRSKESAKSKRLKKLREQEKAAAEIKGL